MLSWGHITITNREEKMLSESEQFIYDYPTLNLAQAREILEMHGFDDGMMGNRGDLGVSFDPEGYEHVCDISPEGDIDTQELFNWLGY
jgi:hypothetical protein